MALVRLLNLVTLLSLLGFGVESLSLAILHLKSNNRYADICVLYNPFYSLVPQTAPTYKIALITPDDTCKEHSSGVNSDSVAFFIKSGGNCTFFEKLQFASKSNAKQVILISPNGDPFPFGTKEQHKNISFPVGRISAATWNSVVNTIGTPQYSQLYHPSEPAFDPNIAFLWVIAVFTVVTGGYWSGKKQNREEDDEDGTVSSYSEYEDTIPPVTPIFLVVFIVMLCITLLLLYYFYIYLIFLVIAIFTIASVLGTLDCLYGLISLYNCSKCRVPENNNPFETRPRVCTIILGMFSLGLSIFWVIIRNDEYGWILQDFLGVCLCITILRHFHLPSLKISAILLIALLLYDIFFVFITPLFSAQGESVMIQVATGEGSGENIPMVIRLPKLIQSAMALCVRPYSLLGLGDILVPGLFVSFCHNFDVTAQTRYRVYFITSSIAYAFGLFLAFLMLVVTKSGQPALLYLSPSVLISVAVVGACRRELNELWEGEIDIDKISKRIRTDSSQQSSEIDESNKVNEKDEKDSLITNEEHITMYNE